MPAPMVVTTRMTALCIGPLTMVDGCLRTGDSEASNLVVWPPDFEVSVENDTIRVLYDDHEVEVRLGQVVRLGGGEVKSLEAFDERTRQQIPAGCPGPYWLAGSISPGEETERPGAPADLDSAEWVLTSLNGESLIEDTEITLNFKIEFLGGFMGCNGYGGGPDSGKYTATDDGTLTIPHEIAVTVQLCSEPKGIMEQEAAYIEALRSAAAYRVVDDRLEIANAAGETTLVFAWKEECLPVPPTPAPMPPTPTPMPHNPGVADLLADHLRQAFEKQHGVDLRNDRRAMARLTRAAEKAKIVLSSRPFAWVREEYLMEKQGKPLHLELEVSRHEFEKMIENLLGSTRTSIQQALADAKMTIKDLDKVLLVGGSTYIPAVWELAADATGLDPRQEVHPSEAVALGAGIQAAIIAGQPIEAILVDVTPHSLDIEVAEWTWRGFVNDRYNSIIHRNTTIPVTRERVYSTLHPNQDTVHLKVYQGEHPIASKNTLLDDFTFTDLKPERKGELARVALEFSLDVNGILHVKATDRGSNQEAGIEVAASKERLTQEQISQAQKRLAAAAPTLVLDEGGGRWWTGRASCYRVANWSPKTPKT